MADYRAIFRCYNYNIFGEYAGLKNLTMQQAKGYNINGHYCVLLE